MDCFVKIKQQKKSNNKTPIHEKEYKLLKQYIDDNKNVFICGKPGYGKTTLIQSVLNASNSVEIGDEILQKKDIFLGNLARSNLHTYIEDYESEMYAYRGIIERASDGNSPSKGSLVVTSSSFHILPNFETIFLPKPTTEQLLKLVEEDSVHVHECICRSGGNIRNFLDYIQGSSDKDSFLTPKEYIEQILCEPSISYSRDEIQEHGHVWGAVHENYPNSVGVDMTRAATSLVDADVFDGGIYKGLWELMYYFIVCAVSIPKYSLGEPLVPEKLRPGSAWSKYGNYKMRHQKVRSIQGRSFTSKMDHQHLALLRIYAQNGDVGKLAEYNLVPSDFDVINHLALCNKLKQREVSNIKKKFRTYLENSK